jgi:hypothetical protein
MHVVARLVERDVVGDAEALAAARGRAPPQVPYAMLICGVARSARSKRVPPDLCAM